MIASSSFLLLLIKIPAALSLLRRELVPGFMSYREARWCLTYELEGLFGRWKEKEEEENGLIYSSHSRLAQLWIVNKYTHDKSNVAFSEVLKATQERVLLHSNTSERHASP